ncbi:MAG: hypothetical protein AB7I32_05625 [Gammaproteobacteria bacterium]
MLVALPALDTVLLTQSSRATLAYAAALLLLACGRPSFYGSYFTAR